MDRSNVEIVRDAFGTWNRGDHSAPLDVIDAACVLETKMSQMRGTPYIGHAGFLQWVDDLNEHFDDWQMNCDDWRDHGDQVLGIGFVTFTPKGGATPFDQPFGFLFDMHDGLLVRWRSFGSGEEALAALAQDALSAASRPGHAPAST